MKKCKDNVRMYNYPFKFDGDYINVEDTFTEPWINYYFGIGGRGIGKTYQTGRYLIENNKNFVFCRRTEDEIQILCENDNASYEDSVNPFKQLGEDLGKFFKAIKTGKSSYSIFEEEHWDDKEMDKHVCKLMHIKNVAKAKGFNLTNIDYIFWDEFIPVTKVRDMSEDGYDFMQLNETIARNREIVTGKPVKVIMQANSTTVANSVFLEFGLVNLVSETVKNGFNCLDLPDRGIRVVIFPDNTAFTAKKKETALYKAIPHTSRMYQSSISNTFILDDYSDVKKLSLQHWIPCAIIESYNYRYMVYEHPTKGIYFSNIFSGYNRTISNRFDLSVDADRENFKYYLKAMNPQYITGNITFCDMQAKTIFKQYSGRN